MYRTVNNDLSDLKDVKYDIIAFFSALEIKSLFEQFPDFEQEAAGYAFLALLH